MSSSCLYQNDDKFIPIVENVLRTRMVGFLKPVLPILPQSSICLALKTNTAISHLSLKCNRSTNYIYPEDIGQLLKAIHRSLGLIVNFSKSD